MLGLLVRRSVAVGGRVAAEILQFDLALIIEQREELDDVVALLAAFHHPLLDACELFACTESLFKFILSIHHLGWLLLR